MYSPHKLLIMDTNTSNNKNSGKQKKWFTFSNVLTLLMLAFVLAMLINPNVKAFVIQNLMKVGLFQPSVPSGRQAEELQDIKNIAPEGITFRDSEGKTISLAELRGKVVFLSFWATWCPPCIAEMPSINNLKQNYKTNEEIVFLMIDADGDFQKSLSFMRKHNYDLPVYSSITQIPESIFGSSLPTTVILDKEGRLVFKHEGSADYESPKIKKFIDGLLSK